MIRRKPALIAAVAALGLLAMGAASAPASTALRTDPGGALLTGATTVTNTSSDRLTVVSLLGTFACAQSSFDAVVSRNSSASSITGPLTALTFTSCSGRFSSYAFSSCALSPTSPFPVIHLSTNHDAGGAITIDDLTIRCGFAGAPTSFCYYTAASAAGSFLNAPSVLTYANVAFSGVAGSGSLGAGCNVSATWFWAFTHIVQGGGTNRTVTLATS